MVGDRDARGACGMFAISKFKLIAQPGAMRSQRNSPIGTEITNTNTTYTHTHALRAAIQKRTFYSAVRSRSPLGQTRQYTQPAQPSCVYFCIIVYRALLLRTLAQSKSIDEYARENWFLFRRVCIANVAHTLEHTHTHTCSSINHPTTKIRPPITHTHTLTISRSPHTTNHIINVPI